MSVQFTPGWTTPPDALGSAAQGLASALIAFQRHKEDQREHELRVKEVERRREESEQLRKIRDLHIQEAQHAAELRAQDEKIQEEAERQGALQSFIKGLPKPELPMPGLITDIDVSVRPDGGLATSPAAIAQPTARQTPAVDMTALEAIQKMTPSARLAGRRQLAENEAVRAAKIKEAEDLRRDSVIAPYDVTIQTPEGSHTFKAGERIPNFWMQAELQRRAQESAERIAGARASAAETAAERRARQAEEGKLISVYDNQAKENVMRTPAQIKAEPNRYVSEKRGTASGEGGKPPLAGEVQRLTEIEDSLKGADDLEKAISGAGDTGLFPRLGAWAPDFVTEYTGFGSDAKKRNAVIKLTKQIIGKGLEGGVLRKEDEAKYAEILPTISDAPEVARDKIRKLKARLKAKQESELDNLQDAGRDVSKYRQRLGVPGSSGAAGAAGGGYDKAGILTEQEKANRASTGNKLGLPRP